MKRLFIIAAFLIAGVTNADDVQWAKGYTADCDNATEREDGTALPADEIAVVKYMIATSGTATPTHTAIMAGGCNPTFIDTKRYVPVGDYFLYGITVDTDGQESVVSSPGVPLTVMKARPKPPSGLR